jgi:hypothetical protein
MELLTNSLLTFCISLLQVEALERVKKSKIDEDQSDEKALVQEELSKIMLNPNVFTDFKVAGSQEVWINADIMNTCTFVSPRIFFQDVLSEPAGNCAALEA